jgi:hypothetical protein
LDLIFTRDSDYDVPLGPPKPHISPLPPPPTRVLRPPPKRAPNVTSKPKFLYIRHSKESHAAFNIVVLKCSVCARTDFISLQGLYNHARISHKVEWGNHEECLRACATWEKEDDLDLSTGSEINNSVLPGIKTLFEKAMLPEPQYKGDVDMDGAEEDTPGAYLTKTLGLHSESSGLAPFLGKVAKRREIKVWDVDQDVNIFDDPLERNVKWRKPLPGLVLGVRGLSSHEDKESSDHSLMETDNTIPEGEHLSGMELPGSSNSRFRISVRLIITDRSFFIPEGMASLHIPHWSSDRVSQHNGTVFVQIITIDGCSLQRRLLT